MFISLFVNKDNLQNINALISLEDYKLFSISGHCTCTGTCTCTDLRWVTGWIFRATWFSDSGHWNLQRIWINCWCFFRFPFSVAWYLHSWHWNFWPICTDFLWVTRFLFRVDFEWVPRLFFLTSLIFKIWTLEFLAHMHRSLMGNKVTFPSCLMFTIRTLEFSAHVHLTVTNFKKWIFEISDMLICTDFWWVIRFTF